MKNVDFEKDMRDLAVVHKNIDFEKDIRYLTVAQYFNAFILMMIVLMLPILVDLVFFRDLSTWLTVLFSVLLAVFLLGVVAVVFMVRLNMRTHRKLVMSQLNSDPK